MALFEVAVLVAILSVTQAGLAPVSYASVAGHGLGVGVTAPGVYLGGAVRPVGPAFPLVAGPLGYAGKTAVAAAEGVDYYCEFDMTSQRHSILAVMMSYLKRCMGSTSSGHLLALSEDKYYGISGCVYISF
ncbi:hypothetical protein Trydic_g9492 [Trypoxylus dichotomus]